MNTYFQIKFSSGRNPIAGGSGTYNHRLPPPPSPIFYFPKIPVNAYGEKRQEDAQKVSS